MHVLHADGKMLQFDNGFRVPATDYIRRGESNEIRMPLSSILQRVGSGRGSSLLAEFALVQDGNAWFGDIACRVPLD